MQLGTAATDLQGKHKALIITMDVKKGSVCNKN